LGQVGKDQLYGLDGGGAGALGGGTANVGFHRVGQRVHAGGGRQVRRQAQRHVGVQHRIMRDQRKIVDGVFVVDLFVGDHGGQRRLAAGAGRRRHGDQQRQAA